MIDPDRTGAMQLASAICQCLDRGEQVAAVRERFVATIAPHFKLGERAGRLHVDWCMRWVGTGLPHIMPNAKLAASFMATEVPSEFCDQVIAPWHAFMATVPAGVFQPGECTVFVDVKEGPGWRPQRLDGDEAAAQDTDQTQFARVMFTDRRSIGPNNTGVHWNVCERWRDFTGDVADEAATMRDGHKTPAIARRGLQAIMRFVFGVCAEMSLHDRPEAPGAHRKRTKQPARDGGAPTAWTIRQTRAVRDDVRSYVTDYLSGARGSLKTQHVVRGHWRNQPYGPQSSLRKFIHIEPHWKGAKDVPIAVRAHRLGNGP